MNETKLAPKNFRVPRISDAFRALMAGLALATPTQAAEPSVPPAGEHIVMRTLTTDDRTRIQGSAAQLRFFNGLVDQAKGREAEVASENERINWQVSSAVNDLFWFAEDIEGIEMVATQTHISESAYRTIMEYVQTIHEAYTVLTDQKVMTRNELFKLINSIRAKRAKEKQE